MVRYLHNAGPNIEADVGGSPLPAAGASFGTRGDLVDKLASETIVARRCGLWKLILERHDLGPVRSVHARREQLLFCNVSDKQNSGDEG